MTIYETARTVQEIDGIVTADNRQYKQVIVVRIDIGMSVGKLAVQVAHASVTASENTKLIYHDIWNRWYSSGQKKVVLKVSSLDELEHIMSDTEEIDIVTALISDAGLTELEPGTVTCLGIGPHLSDTIDLCTGHLKTL